MENTVNRCENQIAEWLKAALVAAFGEDAQSISPRVQPATDPRFGDFQCNDAMQLAKRLHKPPRVIAETVTKALPLPDALSKIEVAGPGFINLTVNPAWLAYQLRDLSAAPGFGIPNAGAGKTVVIDYSSPNAAKQMHIGHIRSTVIGNALDRIYRALGYRVISDNHLGDWGTQFGILIEGYRHFLTDAQREALSVADLEKAYVESYNRAKEDEAWMDTCRKELVKLQQGDPENHAIWKRFIDISIAEFNRMYARLDVSFDLWRGESFYNDKLAGIVNSLKEKGLAEESEGAQIVRLEEEGLPVCLIQKSDGGFNYATTDLATVQSRVAEFNPERIVYVTDERQQLHFKQFFAICRKLGVTADLVHVWFGLMRLPDATFSTRQGNVIKLDDLLNEAVRRARAIIDASNPEMPEVEKANLAEEIGIGAIKYADLSHDPQTLVVFTWEKAMALEGNSGPYLQYAYARVCSLLDKYAELVPGGDPLANPLALDSETEKALALKLMQFPATVLRAAEAYKPSILADYLFSLAQAYSSFYQRSPVLKSEPAVRDSRIHLCALVAQVLAEGLHLLGIRTPRRI
ncbi:MAG: arginine--tRNA ligase [Kiritimatiellae bacterium]|nr:arginine--tRNA ligase [Kiritimatiellia bacterium]